MSRDEEQSMIFALVIKKTLTIMKAEVKENVKGCSKYTNRPSQIKSKVTCSCSFTLHRTNDRTHERPGESDE